MNIRSKLDQYGLLSRRRFTSVMMSSKMYQQVANAFYSATQTIAFAQMQVKSLIRMELSK